MKKALILILSIVSIQTGFGQYYNFKLSTGNYDSIQGGQKLIRSGNFYNYTLPTPVNFFGIEMKPNVLISDEGFVALQGDTNSVAFDVAQADMLPGPGNSGVFAQLDTINGEPVLMIEWRNMLYQGHPSSDIANFKAHIFLKNQVLEFRYGNIIATSTQAFSGAPAPLVFFSLSGISFTDVREYYLAVGDPANPTVLYNQFGPGSLTSVPPEDVVYRFEPNNIHTSEEFLDVIEIFPNPVKDEFLNVRVPIDETYNYEIRSSDGGIVAAGFISSRELSIRDLAPGVYQIILQREGQLIGISKFIRQ